MTREELERHFDELWIDRDGVQIHPSLRMLADELRRRIPIPAIHNAPDGMTRQDHYGEGRQPWDDIVAAGWDGAFAAGNILKYLRRTKDPEHSIESARWYWARLVEMGTYADATRERLAGLLTPDEWRRLTEEI